LHSEYRLEIAESSNPAPVRAIELYNKFRVSRKSAYVLLIGINIHVIEILVIRETTEMKMFLTLLVLCTVPTAFASAGSAFTQETSACEDGASPRSEEQTVQNVEISEDLTTATVEGRKYTLALAGKGGILKKRYMAVPQFESDMREHFYIEIPGDMAGVVIYKSDFMARDCGGGLIATQLRPSNVN
jgi:hypothetical protein